MICSGILLAILIALYAHLRVGANNRYICRLESRLRVLEHKRSVLDRAEAMAVSPLKLGVATGAVEPLSRGPWTPMNPFQ